MNCEESRALLTLYREGELPAERRRELSQHLSACLNCSALAEEYRRTDSYVSQLRDTRPVLPDAAGLARSIVEQIRSEAGGRRASSRRGFLDRLLDLFEVPSIRLASGGITALLVIVFTVQCLQLATGIASLEDRYDRPERPVLVPATGYLIDFGGSPAPHLGSLLSFLGLTRQELQSRELVVNRETVRSLEERLGSGLPKGTAGIRPAGLTPEDFTELRDWITTHATQKHILSLKGE
jgi:hypothetical protein